MINRKIIKILVVEDEVYWFDLLHREVERGTRLFHLRWARHGENAIEICKEGNEFDAILMNLSMPLLDGLETTKRIKALGVDTPIIAWTAHPRSVREKACREVGMVDYLEKNAQNLLKDVIEALHRCNAI